MPLAIAVLAVALFYPGTKSASQTFTYTAFINEVTTNKVSTASISSTGAVTGKLDSGSAYVSRIPVALDDTSLSSLLLTHRVQVTGTVPSSTSVVGIIELLGSLLLFVGLFVWMGR